MVYDYTVFLFDFYSLFFYNILFSENFLIQLCIVLTSFYFYNNNNIYYTLFYMFIYFFLVGLFLSFFQLEFFTGFLWLIELTIVFVYLLLLFYLNFKGNINNFKKESKFLLNTAFLIVILLANLFFYKDSESSIKDEFINVLLWEDYYECLCNYNMNDFQSLLISYYYFNSVEFIITGVILFFGSVVCVNLFKINKADQNNNTYDFISTFDFFLNNISFVFLRKQNLVNQNLTIPGIRFIKKKK